MEKTFEFLYAPTAVAIISGLFFYIFKALRFRRTLINGVLNEMNELLQYSYNIKNYLSQDNHYWLKPGMIISEAPILTISEIRYLTPT